jgi:hypothetical protein
MMSEASPRAGTCNVGFYEPYTTRRVCSNIKTLMATSKLFQFSPQNLWPFENAYQQVSQPCYARSDQPTSFKLNRKSTFRRLLKPEWLGSRNLFAIIFIYSKEHDWMLIASCENVLCYSLSWLPKRKGAECRSVSDSCFVLFFNVNHCLVSFLHVPLNLFKNYIFCRHSSSLFFYCKIFFTSSLLKL